MCAYGNHTPQASDARRHLRWPINPWGWWGGYAQNQIVMPTAILAQRVKYWSCRYGNLKDPFMGSAYKKAKDNLFRDQSRAFFNQVSGSGLGVQGKPTIITQHFNTTGDLPAIFDLQPAATGCPQNAASIADNQGATGG